MKIFNVIPKIFPIAPQFLSHIVLLVQLPCIEVVKVPPNGSMTNSILGQGKHILASMWGGGVSNVPKKSVMGQSNGSFKKNQILNCGGTPLTN
jgi:hypothetical protein